MHRRSGTALGLIGLLAVAGCIGMVGVTTGPGSTSGANTVGSTTAPNASVSDEPAVSHTTGSWSMRWTQYGVGPTHEVMMPGSNCIFLHTTEDFKITEGYVAVDWGGAQAATNPHYIILRIGGGEGLVERILEHRVWEGERSQNYTVEVDGWSPEWSDAPPDMLVAFLRPDYIAYAGVEHTGEIRINLHHTGEITEINRGACS